MIKKITLREIVGTQMSIDEMGHLIAGTDEGIMPAAYGCKYDVCSNNRSDGRTDCTTSSCETYTCTSGN